MKKLKLFLLFTFILITGTAEAKIYKWVDAQGKEHFTNHESAIPEEYREQSDTVRGHVNVIKGGDKSYQNREINKPKKEKKVKKRTGRYVDRSRISLRDALVMGSPNAKQKIIVFDDVDCPYCRDLHVELKQVLSKRRDVAFYIMMNPLPIHPAAFDKSRAILCKKSIKALNDAMLGKEPGPPECDWSEKIVRRHMNTASKLGINGTPALIMPDGRLVYGAVSSYTIIKGLD